jgi:Collagen triple helix repeat (20 copies)
MFNRIHQKLGTAGFIISIIALVAALGGGAYAASGGLTGKQKKEVTKIAQTEAKKFAGKTGATGPAGSNGTNGANGAKGDTGAAGAEGKQGTEGKPGKEGPEGEPGEPGSPWTLGGVLPKGATETGTWSINSSGKNFEVLAPISFPVRLKAALASANVHFVTSTSTVCTGTVQEPTAPQGVLCVYQAEAFKAPGPVEVYNASGQVGGASPTGAFVDFEEVEAEGKALGTWAVTGN